MMLAESVKLSDRAKTKCPSSVKCSEWYGRSIAGAKRPSGRATTLPARASPSSDAVRNARSLAFGSEAAGLGGEVLAGTLPVGMLRVGCGPAPRSADPQRVNRARIAHDDQDDHGYRSAGAAPLGLGERLHHIASGG
jgi:hypothetical protein